MTEKGQASSGVRSDAVVKYSVPKPAKFIQLKCNTDLNLAPSNWLSSAADSYGLQHLMSKPKGFSSIRMAHMFPDYVGEVDVVSDSDNIKKLLKIPYSKSYISMMVHRIGNTVLLEDFDIYTHVLRDSELNWEWLSKFLYENVSKETCREDRNWYIRSRRRDALKQKALVSKFLYHSLEQNCSSDESSAVSYPIATCTTEPLLPEPNTSTADYERKYNRNVLWTFEDIQMLIGTDLPIFGGGTHPCISLRLRDASKPINVLTGIDYWLDNLMSNVPEVVMCYHLNGIVQTYELIKTEDLPSLENSRFSPDLIRDVAQSILSFLKSNATKAGHTYWLFKGTNEDVVKLYDLTSLCNDDDVETCQNPFTIPVAMLLYRVARNMKNTTDNHANAGTVRKLLVNCIKLLRPEEYPEIVTSSHYMMSDLYVPASINPESPNFDDDVAETDSSTTEDEDSDEYASNEAAKELILNEVTSGNARPAFKHYYKRPPPITGSIEERCEQALKHVLDGLRCLQFFNTANSSCRTPHEDEIKMANPNQPIPMGCSGMPLETDDLESDNTTEKSLINVAENAERNVASNSTHGQLWWKEHLKTLLYEKMVLVYVTWCEHKFCKKDYGTCLRMLGILARCLTVCQRIYDAAASRHLKESWLLGRVGDCCVLIVQCFDSLKSHKTQFHAYTDLDRLTMEQLSHDERQLEVNLGNSTLKCALIFDLVTIEQLLVVAVDCYEKARQANLDAGILRRLGNALNETASYYLSMAKSYSCTRNDDPFYVEEMCNKAHFYLHKGIEVFAQAKDCSNMALLYTNVGHLYIIRSNIASCNDKLERKYYNNAVQNMKKALQVLGKREVAPSIWDATSWELSTVMFNMAVYAHDNPISDMNTTDVRREIVESLKLALTSCNLSEDCPKLPLYQYRAAEIYLRMGSIYHRQLLSDEAEAQSNRKNITQVVILNYQKASNLYLIVGDAKKYLRCQMKLYALFEHLASGSTLANKVIEHLDKCLAVACDTNSMLKLIIEQKVDVSEIDATESNGGDTCDSSFVEPTVDLHSDSINSRCYDSYTALLNLFTSRLQYTLKRLIKLCLTKLPSGTKTQTLTQAYKDCYKYTFDLKRDTPVSDLIIPLSNSLDKIADRLKSIGKSTTIK